MPPKPGFGITGFAGAQNPVAWVWEAASPEDGHLGWEAVGEDLFAHDGHRLRAVVWPHLLPSGANRWALGCEV